MSLNRYIEQLIKDLSEATRNVPEHWHPLDNEKDDEFGILPWMEDAENAPTKSLEEWTRIKKEQFPPDSRLSDAQINRLLHPIKKMLDSYNCSAVFQIEVPERIQYRVIRERFRQEVPMLKANYFFFELCVEKDGKDRSQCIMGPEYCHCAFFEAFFERFEDDNAEEETNINIDPYEQYMLKRRYGKNWQKYIQYEEEFDHNRDEDDLGLEDLEDDLDDNIPL